MTEKGIRGEICHKIYKYAKANNKYMKNFNKRIELSSLMYLDANNLYGWAIFQKLSINGFKWRKNVSKFDEDFDEDSNKGYILEVDVEYPKFLHNLHSGLAFLSERMEIKKLVCNFYDKKEYIVYIRDLKQALHHEIIFKKVHRVMYK